MKTSVEYRGIARSNLNGNWGNAIIVCLIATIISTLLGFIPIVGYVVTILLTGQLAVGEFNYFIKLHNKEDASVGSVFVNFGSQLLNNFIVYILQTIYVILWMLLFIIPGIIKGYSYAMTMFLKSKNPQLGANEAITLSRKIMDGKKWSLFCLHFSFIGWVILSVLTLGIGLIFLLPYMQSAITAFYEDAYNQYQHQAV